MISSVWMISSQYHDLTEVKYDDFIMWQMQMLKDVLLHIDFWSIRVLQIIKHFNAPPVQHLMLGDIVVDFSLGQVVSKLLNLVLRRSKVGRQLIDLVHSVWRVCQPQLRASSLSANNQPSVEKIHFQKFNSKLFHFVARQAFQQHSMRFKEVNKSGSSS